MKPISLLFTAIVFASCQPSADEQAARAMHRIDSLYDSHDYQGTLNAIRQLRDEYPKAVKSRQKALKIWQEASLKMTQQDIGPAGRHRTMECRTEYRPQEPPPRPG